MTDPAYSTDAFKLSFNLLLITIKWWYPSEIANGIAAKVTAKKISEPKKAKIQ